MEKLDGKSMNIIEKNISIMKNIFPDVFIENKIDYDKLKLLLGDKIEDNNERYEFRWHGKLNAIKNAQVQSMGTLRPSIEESKSWNHTSNIYIEGDNLEVLKLLQKSYFGKVKLIYIDPPYNTGKDFIYPDDFRDSLSNYKKLTNQTTKANVESDGKYHTKWLNMIYPRLKVARNLLSEDGIILISIDEYEFHNLKKICDEIFGESNFIGDIPRKTKSSTNDPNNNFNNQQDYILLYRKSENSVLRGIEKDFSNYKNPDNDKNGPWKSSDPSAKSGGNGTYFEIVNPYTGKVDMPPKGRYWAFNKESLRKYIDSGKITFKKEHKESERGFIFKTYLNQLGNRYKPVDSLMFTDNIYMNQSATKELNDMEIFFDYSKPVDLIEDLIKYCMSDQKGIVMDFFSGSSTTAQAVMSVNAQDNGDRKFIMVQFPELIDENSDAYKAGYKNICELAKERIRKSGDKIKSETGKTDLDIGFKVFKLDDSNIKEWSPNYDALEATLDEMTYNLKSGRSKEDLLFEILIKMGIELTAPIDEVNVGDKKIYDIGMGSLVICLEDEITEEIIKEIPKYKSDFVDMKVVFKETGFKTDSQKMNAMQNLKQFGITDVRSV